LNPILSRFCEIYVPEYIQNGKIINLHQYRLEQKFGKDETKDSFSKFIKGKIENCNKLHASGELTHEYLSDISSEIYDKGFSCLDLIHYLESSLQKNNYKTLSNILMCFHKIKLEFRCEKLLLLYILDFIFLRSDTNLKNISFI
jgi:hypothetical protein